MGQQAQTWNNTELSNHSSGSHVGVSLEELDRTMEEIFKRVRNEVEGEGKGPTIRYEPLNIAQEPFTTSVLAVELLKI